MKVIREPSPNRVEIRQRKTRVRLLKSAYTLLSSKKFDEVTIQEIATEADVGFGTFYNYFGSKDDIAIQVLDCIIYSMGLRIDAANKRTGVKCVVQVIANSVRHVAQEMISEPMWRWWLLRHDIMADRMQIGFKPFGFRDMRAAIEAGAIQVIDDDIETAWNHLIWLLAGTVRDIVVREQPPETERVMVEAVLRVMGVPTAKARAAMVQPLPAFPPLVVDFTYEASTH